MDSIHELTMKQLKGCLENSADQPWEPFPDTKHLPSLLQRWKKTNHQRWAELQEMGEQLRNEPIPLLSYSDFIRFARDGDRIIYDGKYTSRRKRLAIYTMLFLESRDELWIRALEDVIWAICDEFTWVIPAHVGLYVNEYPEQIWDQPEPPRETVDLCAGDTAFVLAEIVYLLRDELSPWIVYRVKEETEKRIFKVFYEDPRPQNWELKTNNWPSVCASSIGAAAIYWEQDNEKLAGMLWRIIEVLRRFLDGFDEQGATPEGISYWQYGFGMFLTFAELLKQRTGGTVDLLKGYKMSAIAGFPQACLLSNHKTVNFSDSTEEPSLQKGLFYKLKQQFPDKSFDLTELPFNDSMDSWIWSIRDILWGEDDLTVGKSVQSSLQHYFFPGHQWVISKRQTKDGLIAWAAKGGSNAEPHNHNDIGHFIVHVRGKNVFMDIGAGVYTRQYFQPAYRYEQLTAGSHGHSVPMIDGVRQGSGEAFCAKIIEYEELQGNVTYSLDLTTAYSCEHLKQLTRTFVWQEGIDEEGYLLKVEDVAKFDRLPSSFNEVFIVSSEPLMREPGKIELGAGVIMRFDPQNWSLSTESHIHPTKKDKENIFWRVILTCLTPSTHILSRINVRCL